MVGAFSKWASRHFAIQQCLLTYLTSLLAKFVLVLCHKFVTSQGNFATVYESLEICDFYF